MSDFYKYFKQNMDSMGLPSPETLFGTAQTAIANVMIFLSHIDKYGKAITVGELIGAGTRLEKLGVVASLSASFYVGAVIGSIAVASGKTMANGTSLSDVLAFANRFRLNRPWLPSILTRNPEIFSRQTRAKTAP